MIDRFYKFLNSYYPQNYIIRNPVIGGIIISGFCFGFSALYKPMDFHASHGLNYATTMAIYSLGAGLSVIFAVRILKTRRWFVNIHDWTIFKEILSVIFVLSFTGIIVYFLGFIIEAPVDRLKITTFLNSIKNVFLLGILPFAFLSAVNYRYLSSGDLKNSAETEGNVPLKGISGEDLVRISSQLKKEELNFYPSQFIYAESDGNYVVFYLTGNDQIRKQIIRNSISSIEKQLSAIPYFLRIHRSFIVNLKKVKSKHGNILGYQLKLTGAESKIPVSRNKIKIFDKLFSKYSCL